MADFIADKDFIPDQPVARTPATGGSGFIPDSRFVSDEDRYGDAAGILKSAGLGAARSATFGLSDELLTRTGLVTPEELKGYKETNPTASTVGDVVGIAGSMALAPEAAALKGAGAALKAAELTGDAVKVAEAAKVFDAAKAASETLSGFGARGLLNPVKSVSRLGGTITEAAALPGLTTAGKVLSQAGALAAGSAAEFAVYGLGQSITEHALGDPDLNAEKVLSNMGTSALFGGALGAAFGAVKGGFQAKFPKFISQENRAAIESGDLKKTIEFSDLPEKEKTSWIEGLSRQKSNATEIDDAFKTFGAKAPEAVLSDNSFVQNGYNLLLNGAPTVSALRQQELATSAWNKIVDGTEQTIGNGTKMSKADLGTALKDGFTAKFEAQYAPIKQLYSEIEPYREAIPVSNKSTNALSRTIKDLIKEHSLIKGTPEYNFVETMSEGISQVDNLAKLANFKKALNRSTTQETKFISSAINEKFENLETKAIRRFAENEMKTPKAKSVILDLLDKTDAAKSGYSEFRDEIQKFGNVIGKKKIYGPQDFLDHMEEMTPEKFASDVWKPKNSKFQEYLAKSYPEEFELIKANRIAEIKADSMKNGEFDPRRLFKEFEGLTKEERNLLFSKEQQSAIGKANLALNSFPKSFNPSNTSNASAYRDFFTSPTKAIIGNVRDAAIEKFVTTAAKFDPDSSPTVAGLAKIERMKGAVTRSIISGVNDIFSGKATKLIYPLLPEEKNNDHDKIKPKLNDLGADASKLIDHISENTNALSEVAPDTARAMHMTMARATQFLQQKLPGQDVAKKPLSNTYQPSEAEIAKWHKYYSAVENPTNALKQVAVGNISAETMETLSVVYPKLLNEMQIAVTDKMSDAIAKKKLIPYRTKMALSMFLGSDLVNSLEPKTMLAMQNTMSTATQAKANMEQAQMSGASRKSLGTINKSNNFMTPMQKSAAREDA